MVDESEMTHCVFDRELEKGGKVLIFEHYLVFVVVFPSLGVTL